VPLRRYGRPRCASLAALASTAGYADQSHLSRDCRRLAGTTPARLLAAARSMTDPSKTVRHWSATMAP